MVKGGSRRLGKGGGVLLFFEWRDLSMLRNQEGERVLASQRSR